MGPWPTTQLGGLKPSYQRAPQAPACSRLQDQVQVQDHLCPKLLSCALLGSSGQSSSGPHSQPFLLILSQGLTSVELPGPGLNLGLSGLSPPECFCCSIGNSQEPGGCQERWVAGTTRMVTVLCTCVLCREKRAVHRAPGKAAGLSTLVPSAGGAAVPAGPSLAPCMPIPTVGATGWMPDPPWGPPVCHAHWLSQRWVSWL